MLIDQSIWHFGTFLHFVRHYGIRHNGIKHSGMNPASHYILFGMLSYFFIHLNVSNLKSTLHIFQHGGAEHNNHNWWVNSLRLQYSEDAVNCNHGCTQWKLEKNFSKDKLGYKQFYSEMVFKVILSEGLCQQYSRCELLHVAVLLWTTQGWSVLCITNKHDYST